MDDDESSSDSRSGCERWLMIRSRIRSSNSGMANTLIMGVLVSSDEKNVGGSDIDRGAATGKTVGRAKSQRRSSIVE